MTAPRVAACSSCGRAIIWALSPTGARIPLDARPIVAYACVPTPGATPLAVPTVNLLEDETHLPLEDDVSIDRRDGERLKVYVSHFVSCPNANEHSKARGAR